ncbi:MAG: stage III sporulation protein AE [Oscillospiraceae bacterium]|jgi:stage III sporulation protein AE|nr:stage III sporulation protein AE [Oscillospiraceae bacterium]
MAKRTVRIFILVSLLLTSLTTYAHANETAPQATSPPQAFEAQLEASGANGLAGALPQDARESLAQLGVEGMDFYAVLAASPRDILQLLFDFLGGGIGKVLGSGALAMGAVVLLALLLSLLPEDEKTRHTLEVTGSMMALLLLLPGLAELMRGAVAVVRAGSDFSLLLIPVLAGVITAAGNPMLALSYHSLAFAAAQGLAQLADGVVVPCTGVVLGLSLVDTAAKDAHLSALAELIKKAVIGVFALLAGLFSALLGIKSLIANTADAMVLRGVKVVAGSVPVVGGALSEAAGAILGSVALVKGTIGGFALLAALVLYAPILAELLLWSVMLKLLAAMGELFGQSNAAAVFKNVAYAVAILTACVVFNAALLLVSTGLVISIRNQ